MHGLVAHVAYDDLVFVIVLAADLATLAIRAFPKRLLHKIEVQRRLMALRVVGLPTAEAGDSLICIRVEVEFHLASVALRVRPFSMFG